MMHAGGTTEFRKIAALADTWLVPVAPHDPAGPILMLAAIHVMASIPNRLVLEQIEGEGELRDSICTHPIPLFDGDFELTDRPGLGTYQDLTALRDHPFQSHPYVRIMDRVEVTVVPISDRRGRPTSHA